MKSRTIALVSSLIVLLVTAFASPSTLAASSTAGQAPQARAAFQGASPLAAAFVKTAAATVFKMREDFSGSPLLMPGPAATGDKPVTAMHAEAEFNGKDYSVKMHGLVASFFNDDPAKDFQVIQVGDKTYIHGPASTFSAPEDKWYLLDPGNTMSMSFTPFDILSRIANSKGGWSRFKQSQTGVSLDGVKCDTYAGGTDAAADIYSPLVQDMMPPDSSPVLDTGTVSFSVCGDGYVHNLVADFAAHDKANPSSKGTGKYSLDLSGFGSSITIAPPADAVALAGSSSSQANSTPTPGRQVAAGSATGYDGDWEGTTKDDMDISFTVESNAVTFINLGYAVHTGSCSVSGSYSLNPPKTTIANKAFSLQLTDSSGRQYTFDAAFDAPNQAHGNLRVKGTSDTCGAFDVQSTWTASLTAATPTPDTSASGAGSSTATPADAGSVIGGLFEMLNAKNADAALDLVSDDAVVNWGATTIMDKDQLKTFLTSQTGRGITYKVSNAQVVGDTIVNFVVQESGGGSTLYSKSTAIVSGGLIDILTLK